MDILFDVGHFLSKDKSVAPEEVVDFSTNRTIEWEIRQLSELVTVVVSTSECVTLDEKIHSFVENLNHQTARIKSVRSVSACNKYLERILPLCKGRLWEKPICDLFEIINKQPASGLPHFLSLSHSYIDREIDESIGKIESWRSQKKKLSINYQEKKGEFTKDIVPLPDMINKLVGIDIAHDFEVINLELGETWRKWFSLQKDKYSRHIWLSTNDDMSREQAFVWHALHDGSHMFHLTLLQNTGKNLLLGSYPYWSVSEAFAMYMEHCLYDAICNEKKHIDSYISDYKLNKDRILEVLLDGFIEREFRWVSVLSTQLNKAPKISMSDSELHGSEEFKFLFPMQWYYVRGYSVFNKLDLEDLILILEYGKPFPHPRFLMTHV